VTEVGDPTHALVSCQCGKRYMSSATWQLLGVSSDCTLWPVPSQKCPSCKKSPSAGSGIQAHFGEDDGSGLLIPDDFDDYQEFTSTTSTFKDTVKADCTCPKCGHEFTDTRLEFFGHATYTILGLIGEIGEVAEKLKKHIRNGHDMRELKGEESLKKEFGDVTWYLAASARMFGFKLSDVISTNVTKIKSRKARGVLHGKGDNR